MDWRLEEWVGREGLGGLTQTRWWGGETGERPGGGGRLRERVQVEGWCVRLSGDCGVTNTRARARARKHNSQRARLPRMISAQGNMAGRWVLVEGIAGGCEWWWTVRRGRGSAARQASPLNARQVPRPILF
jgi:hypothetical protein